MLEKLLTAVDRIIKDHELSSNKNGELFNIFKILRAQKSEVNTHSRFIKELLDPKGAHGEAEKFTNLFIETIDPNLLGHGNYIVKREDQTEDGKRIDLTIESPGQFIIGLEMKIYAGDQPQQLFAYNVELKKRVTKGAKTKLVYLTLDGREASGISLNDPDGLYDLNSSNYIAVSFETDILDWLEKCIDQTDKIELKAALKQYYRLIEVLTGVSRTVNKKASEILTSCTENFRAANEIEGALTQAKIDLQFKFWERLNKELTKEASEPFHWFQGQDKFNGASPIKNQKRLVEKYVKRTRKSKPLGLKHLICSKEIESEACNIYFYIRLQYAIQYGIRVESANQTPIKLDKDYKKAKIALYEELYKADSSMTADALINKKHKGWLLGYYRDQNDNDKILNFFEMNDFTSQTLINENSLNDEIFRIIQQYKNMAIFAREQL